MQKTVEVLNNIIWSPALIVLLVGAGAVTESNTAWAIGDIGLGLTTWINIIALLLLFPQALRALKECEENHPVRRKSSR